MNAKHPMQPVIRDESGVSRFKPNKIVRWLLDEGRPHGLDLNKIAVQNFPQEDEEHFAQLIGYSINGFCELSYVSEAAKDVAVGLEAFIDQNVPMDDGIVEMEFTPRPAEPDGSVHVGQLDLFCGILNHITKRHPGLFVDDRVEVIRQCCDRIVEAYSKPTKEQPCETASDSQPPAT